MSENKRLIIISIAIAALIMMFYDSLPLQQQGNIVAGGVLIVIIIAITAAVVFALKSKKAIGGQLPQEKGFNVKFCLIAAVVWFLAQMIMTFLIEMTATFFSPPNMGLIWILARILPVTILSFIVGLICIKRQMPLRKTALYCYFLASIPTAIFYLLMGIQLGILMIVERIALVLFVLIGVSLLTFVQPIIRKSILRQAQD